MKWSKIKHQPYMLFSHDLEITENTNPPYYDIYTTAKSTKRTTHAIILMMMKPLNRLHNSHRHAMHKGTVYTVKCIYKNINNMSFDCCDTYSWESRTFNNGPLFFATKYHRLINRRLSKDLKFVNEFKKKHTIFEVR